MRELGVALIGGGFMGRAHSLAYALAGISANIGAVIHKRVLADVNADLAEKQAAALGWEGWSDDWTAVISRDDVDIVDICTPPQFHEEIALKAIAVETYIL
jgi:predicted dehydrogenase